MAILDGRRVPACDIDPARHRFIGMWRPPELTALTGSYFVARWTEGLYDEPQYVTHRPLVRWDAEKQAFEPVADPGDPLALAVPVEFCGNCRFFTDHKEAPGECRAHPTVVEKFSFHWCGEWEPRDA